MTFNELKVGQKASIQKTFTAADVTAFAGISLDVNPIHMSDAYAKETVFGKRIVHGILTSGLISAVLANKLPGPGTIYLGQELRLRDDKSYDSSDAHRPEMRYIYFVRRDLVFRDMFDRLRKFAAK